jgi:hypothetical protein
VGKSDLPDTSPDHRLVVRVGDVAVGDVKWDGDAGVEVFEMAVDGALLAGGAPTVRIEAPGGLPGVAYDQFYVDWIEVVAERACRLGFDVFVSTDLVHWQRRPKISPWRRRARLPPPSALAFQSAEPVY